MEWISRLRALTNATDGSSRSRACRILHLNPQGSPITVRSPVDASRSEGDRFGENGGDREHRLGFEVGGAGDEGTVKVEVRPVEGRYGHRMIVLTLPLTILGGSMEGTLSAGMLFGGFAADETPFGQVHILPLSVNLPSKNSNQTINSTGNKLCDNANGDEEIEGEEEDEEILKQAEYLEMIKQVTSDPQWLHLQTDFNSISAEISEEKKNETNSGEASESGWYRRGEDGKGWERYSDEVNRKLETVWRMHSPLADTATGTQSKNRKGKGKGKGKGKRSNEDTKDVESSLGSLHDENSWKERRVPIDETHFVDVVKLVQLRFNEEKRCRAVKRVGDDGSVLAGGDDLDLARGFHSMVDIPADHLVLVFGGRHKSMLNDLWAFDYHKMCWKCLDAGGHGKDRARPSARIGHSAVEYGGDVWIFGGFDSLGFACNDLFRFDLAVNQWTKVQPISPSEVEVKNKHTKKKGDKHGMREGLDARDVSGRYHHTAVVHNDKMLVFGGLGDDGKIPVKNDVLEYDFKSNRWSRLKTKGEAPCERWGHIGLVDDSNGECMVVYGGTKSRGAFLDDMHELDLQTLTWYSVTLTGSLPSPSRTYAAAVRLSDTIYTFGGTSLSPDHPPFSETFAMQSGWMLDMEGIPAELAMLIFGNPVLGVRDLLMIGGVCRRWRELSMDDSLWKKSHQTYVPPKYEAASASSSGTTETLRDQVIRHMRDWWELEKERLSVQKRLRKLVTEPLVKESGDLIQLSNVYRRKHESIPKIKMVVVGDSGVGKTCTICSWAHNSFPYEYVPTVMDNTETMMMVRGAPISLSVWDTAADDVYERLRPLSYPQTDVFLVLFSLTDPESLKRVATKWIPEITQYCPGVPIVIAGNKEDLVDSSDPKNCVDWDQGLVIAAEASATRYRIYSAFLTWGLKSLFDTVAEVALYKPVPGSGGAAADAAHKKCNLQ